MIRRPPRSTLDRSSAASDVYKRQSQGREQFRISRWRKKMANHVVVIGYGTKGRSAVAVSYTHLRAHETVLDLVCRLLLEKKKLIHA